MTSRLIFLIIEVIYSVFLLLSGGTGVNMVTNTEPLTVQQYEINITDEKTIVDKQAKQEFYENIILHSDEQVIKRHGNGMFMISENQNVTFAEIDGIYTLGVEVPKQNSDILNMSYSIYIYPDEDVCKIISNKSDKHYVINGKFPDVGLGEQSQKVINGYEDLFNSAFGPREENSEVYVEYVYTREGYDVVKVGLSRNYATSYFINPETLECHAMISKGLFDTEETQLEFRQVDTDTESIKENKINNEIIFFITSMIAHAF